MIVFIGHLISVSSAYKGNEQMVCQAREQTNDDIKLYKKEQMIIMIILRA
jgi:hypothetical protein